ncbi:hypothetical protein O9993_12850 [Vibrio lentus]|nr:hypothetical protein [Vibrio lentus]
MIGLLSSAGDYASGTKPRVTDLWLHQNLFKPRFGGFLKRYDGTRVNS